jgi:DNA polymerase-1
LILCFETGRFIIKILKVKARENRESPALTFLLKEGCNNMEKLVLIDGNALVHRAYHALPPLTTTKGEAVNAVYGFISILFKVLNDLKPDYVAATFDLAVPTFRHEEFDGYKATRAKGPQELYDQLGRVKQVLKSLNIPIYEKEGFEADDVIGALAKQAEGKDKEVETIIATGDLDTLQLVSDKIKVYTLRKGIKDIMIYDVKAVEERFNGLKPNQMADFKGLKGDPSDNIPGVPGIGDKSAISLLKEYGSIENLYENLHLLPQKTAMKMEEYKEQAIFSKYLATIRIDVPIELDLEKSRLHD